MEQNEKPIDAYASLKKINENIPKHLYILIDLLKLEKEKITPAIRNIKSYFIKNFYQTYLMLNVKEIPAAIEGIRNKHLLEFGKLINPNITATDEVLSSRPKTYENLDINQETIPTIAELIILSDIELIEKLNAYNIPDKNYIRNPIEETVAIIFKFAEEKCFAADEKITNPDQHCYKTLIKLLPIFNNIIKININALYYYYQVLIQTRDKLLYLNQLHHHEYELLNKNIQQITPLITQYYFVIQEDIYYKTEAIREEATTRNESILYKARYTALESDIQGITNIDKNFALLFAQKELEIFNLDDNNIKHLTNLLDQLNKHIQDIIEATSGLHNFYTQEFIYMPIELVSKIQNKQHPTIRKSSSWPSGYSYLRPMFAWLKTSDTAASLQGKEEAKEKDLTNIPTLKMSSIDSDSD